MTIKITRHKDGSVSMRMPRRAALAINVLLWNTAGRAASGAGLFGLSNMLDKAGFNGSNSEDTWEGTIKDKKPRNARIEFSRLEPRA